MCLYCNGFRNNDDDTWYIDQQSISLIDELASIDFDTYISKSSDGKPVIKVVTSYWMNNTGPYEETIKCIPIKYCPFCGAKLEEGDRWK